MQEHYEQEKRKADARAEFEAEQAYLKTLSLLRCACSLFFNIYVLAVAADLTAAVTLWQLLISTNAAAVASADLRCSWAAASRMQLERNVPPQQLHASSMLVARVTAAAACAAAPSACPGCPLPTCHQMFTRGFLWYYAARKSKRSTGSGRACPFCTCELASRAGDWAVCRCGWAAGQAAASLGLPVALLYRFTAQPLLLLAAPVAAVQYQRCFIRRVPFPTKSPPACSSSCPRKPPGYDAALERAEKAQQAGQAVGPGGEALAGGAAAGSGAAVQQQQGGQQQQGQGRGRAPPPGGHMKAVLGGIKAVAQQAQQRYELKHVSGTGMGRSPPRGVVGAGGGELQQFVVGDMDSEEEEEALRLAAIPPDERRRMQRAEAKAKRRAEKAAAAAQLDQAKAFLRAAGLALPSDDEGGSSSGSEDSSSSGGSDSGGGGAEGGSGRKRRRRRSGSRERKRGKERRGGKERRKEKRRKEKKKARRRGRGD